MNPKSNAPAKASPHTSKLNRGTPADGQPDKEAPLLVRTSNGITTLTLNRPSSYNALSEALLDALQGALDALDGSTRVVVIAASGKAFCAGHDLKEMRSQPDRGYYDELFARCSRIMQTMLELPQPVVAQVHGMATAAGCQLVANCDLAIASKAAQFAVSGIDVGLFCSTPSVPLSRNMGRKQAFEMLMTGDFISADRAAEIGLINRAVEADLLDGAVTELCKRIASKSAVAVETGKGLFYRQLELPIAEAYSLAAERMACNMMSADAGEGIDAFIAKRKPEWQHR